MNEQQWLSSTSPQEMLDFLGTTGNFSNRKARLFAVACCRRAVAVAEWDADGLTSKEAVGVAARGVAAREVVGAGLLGRLPLWIVAPARAAWAALTGGRESNRGSGQSLPIQLAAIAAATDLLAFVSAKPDEARQHHTVLLRDICGPLPFREVHVDPSLLRWNDCTVVRLAQAIYDDQRWADMPILADALLDAGCDNEEILQHCREQGVVHTRGCWVLDLLLGKS
jgi:hypothetical protein